MMTKFRVWDKDENEMLYTEDSLVMSFCNAGIVATEPENPNKFFIEIENFELMQSTGIKDINDKEIYEGDIVNIHTFAMGGSYDGAIELDTLYINAIITYSQLEENGIYEWCIKRKDFESPISSLDGLHEESFHVIGNIYENPELLED